MAWIYVLKSIKNGKMYIGSTRSSSPAYRLQSHNNKGTVSTKSGIPWVIIHQEYYESYTKARIRELFLKSGRGREIIKQMKSE